MQAQYDSLQTNRLVLENISNNDVDFFYSQFGFANNFINKYLFDMEPLKSIEDAKQMVDWYISFEPKLQHCWIITLKENNKKIGTCGFHFWNIENSTCEIGYSLVQEYNGMGYMDESIKEVINYCTQKLGIKKISACIFVENGRSKHLVEKNGFIKKGEKVEVFRGNEYLHDIYVLEKNQQLLQLDSAIS